MSNFNIVVKIVFISVAVTFIMYGLNGFTHIKNILSGTVKIINKIPILDTMSEFTGGALSRLYVQSSAFYDKMGVYGMPDNPLPDDYYMY